MAWLGPSAAALQARGGSAVAARAIERHPAASGGAAGWRQAAATTRPVGGGRAACDGRLSSRLQTRRTTLAIVPGAAADGHSSGEVAARRKRGGPQPTPVPDVDAAQLLRSLGLDGTVAPAAVLDSIRKLPGVRQQGVLNHAAAVAAHLLSPAVGLTAQQVGQLLEGCPYLFSWPPEQRAAVLFGQLMAAGLTAAEAAHCFDVYPKAAKCTTFAPGLAELAAILAHSVYRERHRGGAADVIAQRTAASLLKHQSVAVMLVCQRAGYLQRRAAELQQAGYTAADVAAMAREQPFLLGMDAAARLADAAAVLQQELGLTAAQVDSLSARRLPRWLTAGRQTVRERAAALAEEFGREAVAAAFIKQPEVLGCSPAVWRRNLCYVAACGVTDPKAVLLRRPQLMFQDHAGPGFLQRRLMLQRAFALSAAQLYQRHARQLTLLQPGELAQRLQFVEQRGQAHRLVAKARTGPKPATASAEERLPALSLVTVTGDRFLPAVGASQADWEAWVAANPPQACPLYRWAQQAAAEEAARLAAALPSELAQS